MKRAWPLHLLPALFLVPLLGKAFGVDDDFFIHYTRILARRPADPFAARFFMNGVETTVHDQPQPLGWSAVAALTRALLGESEVALHLVQILFALVALQALASLARRFAVSPLLACLLFAGSSAFLTAGSSVMPYLPFAALSLVAFDRAVRGTEEERTSDLVLAGLAAGGAFLCCFAGGFVVVALAAYPCLARRRGWRPWLPFAVGLAVLVAYESAAAAVHGSPHFLHAFRLWSRPLDVHSPGRAAIELIQLGGQLPWAVAALLAAAAARRAPGPAVAALAGLPVVAAVRLELAHRLPGWGALAFAWPGSALAAWGIVVAWSAGRRWLRRQPESLDPLRLLLALWLVGGTFATLTYVQVAAKYMLLPLPAAVLLLLDAWRGAPRGRAAPALTAMVGAQLVLGALVAWSDARWAGTYRHFFSADYSRLVPAHGSAYVDAEWGMAFYGQQAGAARYHGQPLRPCDRVFYSELTPHHFAAKIPGPRREVARLELTYAGPFAMMDRAGFYSQVFGLLPYRPETKPRDAMVVLEIAGGACP